MIKIITGDFSPDMIKAQLEGKVKMCKKKILP